MTKLVWNNASIFIFKLIILLSIFLFNIQLEAQEIFNNDILEIGNYEGYIVTLDGDTVEGTIAIKVKDTRVHNEIIFISDQNHETIYQPPELKSFHIGNAHFIGNSIVSVDAIPEFRTVFLQQLIDGYLKYYRLLNYQLASGGPIPVMKTVEYYYVSYGNLKPNRIRHFKDLAIYTRDHYVTDSIIMSGHYQKEELPEILNSYNLWLNGEGKIKQKTFRDSFLSDTKLTLEEALTDSLILFNQTDLNRHEYFFRLLYYAYNTPGYQGYIVYDKRDRMNRATELGIKINISNGYNEVGSWIYYFSDKKPGRLPLRKEESYDINGELHGLSLKYDRITGSVLKKEIYFHGKKQRK